MKRFRQTLALILALVMAVSVFAACGEPKTDDAEAEEAAIIATAVQYLKSGKYTTTVSSEKVDLSGVTADKIEVLYYDAAETKAAATDDEEAQAVYSKAEIISAEKNGDGSWEISFTDKDAATNITSSYVVSFTELKDSAAVTVEFPEMSLEADIDFVTPADHTIDLSMLLSGGEFEGEVTAENIALSDAFAGMEIASVKGSGHDLTVQLKGDLQKSAANTYECGTLSVSPDVIKDGYAYVPAEIPVRLEAAWFDATSLKFEGGKITGDYKVYGVADPAELTKDNVKLDGATVEKVEKADENTVSLTISAEGVTSVNDFAASFSGSQLTLGDYVTAVDLCQAGFYPFYDYVEADGDALRLTLKLYASNGVFADDLSAEQITYDDGFADAKTESLTRDSDTVATLILSIPANGMTEEDMDVSGTVTLAEGALNNLWGEKAYEAGFTRSYNAETLGKGIWDSIKNGFKKIGSAIADGVSSVGKFLGNGVKNLVDIAKKGVDYAKQGLGYVTDYLGLGDLSDLIGGFLGGGNANTEKLNELVGYSKNILAELTAVTGQLKEIQTDVAQIKSDIKDIKNTLNTVLQNQYLIMDELRNIETTQIDMRNDTYRRDLENLQNYINRVSMTFELASYYKALEDAVSDGLLEEMPAFEGVERKDLAQYMQDNYSQYLPDITNMSDKEAAKYCDKIVDYMTVRCNNATDTEFKSYLKDCEKLTDALSNVASALARTDNTNPLTLYDQLCSLKYNFDSQAFEFRASTRLTAILLLSEGMELVTVCEKGINRPLGSTFSDTNELVTAAMSRVLEIPIGHAAEDINANYNVRTKTADVAHCPYSYILNSKVCIVSGMSMAFAHDTSDWRGILDLNNSRNNHDWSKEDLNAFFRRAQGRTLQQELASAGLNTDKSLAIGGFQVSCHVISYIFQMPTYYVSSNAIPLTATSADTVERRTASSEVIPGDGNTFVFGLV